MWRQYQAGGGQGGMDVQVKDPNGNFHQAAWNLQDTAGQYINYMTAQNQWVNRTVDLSSFANDVVSVYLLFVNNTTPAGSTFDLFHSNIAIVSTDGTVTTLYAGQPGTSIPNTYNYGNNGSNLSGVQETVNAGPTIPDGTTMYYHGDHLGSARLMTWAGGWPVASDTFHPFGLEPAGASDTNHYRYASLERDAESGFDHADFRQLASSQGRWTSPDPYDGSYDAGNPQSLNRYAYVLNNPMGWTDPRGLDDDPVNAGDPFTITGQGTSIILINANEWFECWWCQEYYGSYPYTGSQTSSSNTSGSSTPAPPAKRATPPTAPSSGVASRLACAAKYGQAHSIGAAFGGGKVASFLGGNAVSSLLNLGLAATGNGPSPNPVNTYLSGPAFGIPVNDALRLAGRPTINGIGSASGAVRGAALGGIFNAATESGGIASIAGDGAEIAVQGGLEAGEFASGIGLAKFGFDALTVAYGYAFGCPK